MRPSRAGGKVPHGHNTNHPHPLDDTTILTADENGNLGWHWYHAGEPFQWIIEKFDDGEEDFTSYAVLDGTETTYNALFENGRYRVWPADEPQDHLGPNSNEVLIENF